MRTYSLILYSLILPVSLLTGSCSETSKLFVGGSAEVNEKGLFLFEFNDRDGGLKPVSQMDAGPNPTFFCFSAKRDMIYAANEVMEFKGIKGGGVTTLKYNPDNNLWEKKGEMVVPYGGPCYISLSPGGDFLFVANYSSSSVAVVRLGEDGLPVGVSDTILYKAQPPVVSHPHKIIFDPGGKHVYITDLGLDRIMIYDFDKVNGKLIPFRIPSVSLPEGSGPRHFTFNPDGSVLYLINETGSTVMAFAVNENRGLDLLQTITTVAEDYKGRNACAEIVISKSGKFIYGSNRGENTIVVFRIEADGRLKFAGRVPCGGSFPRNFIIDPSGKFLLAGNQRSNDIAVFRLNRKTGIPENPVITAGLKGPACLKFGN